jgi:hypothetical protein
VATWQYHAVCFTCREERFGESSEDVQPFVDRHTSAHHRVKTVDLTEHDPIELE